MLALKSCGPNCEILDGSGRLIRNTNSKTPTPNAVPLEFVPLQRVTSKRQYAAAMYTPLHSSVTNNAKTFAASALLLRGDPRLRKLPPYISFLCVIIGVAWLLLLPLNEYSRRTYVSENALLPGQVHTYFAGSDQNIFRGLKHEVDALGDKSNRESVIHVCPRTVNWLILLQSKRQA
jgi:hypothetical protein